MPIPRCPTCRHRLFQVAEGAIKLRTNILIFKAEGTTVKCPACKADVPLDLRMGDELRKSVAEPPRKLVVLSRKVLDAEVCGK